jgi:hypothetical protein
MNQIPEGASSEACLAYSDHTEGAAEAWQDSELLSDAQRSTIATVCAQVSAAGSSLRSAAQAAIEAERLARKARARFGVLDVHLDMRVMNTSDAVLNGPAMRDRSSPVYKQVFGGTAASAITGAPRREEPDEVERVLEQLDAIDDFSGKATVRDQLQTALTRSTTGLQAVIDAEKAARQAFDAEVNARQALRQVLDQAFGALIQVFPSRRDFVESFFLKRERPSKRSSSATDGATTTTGGATTTTGGATTTTGGATTTTDGATTTTGGATTTAG